MPRLLNAFRDELVTAVIVRRPNDTGSQPPLWLNPWFGTPGPGETPPGGGTNEVGVDAVLNALTPSGFSLGVWNDKDRRSPTIEVRIRTAKNKGYIAEDLEQQIVNRLLPRFGPGRPNDQLLGGSVQVNEVTLRLPLQQLGADNTGYEHMLQLGVDLPR